MNYKKEIIGFSLIIVILFSWIIWDINKAEASINNGFISQLKTEIKDTNIILIDSEYCRAVNINAQYAYFTTERDYYIGTVKKSFTLEYNTVGLCRDYWKTASSKNKLITLVHELGHAFYYKRFNQKEEFKKLHNDSKKDSDFYREYGKTNEHEDFATVFESLIYNYDSTYSGKLKEKRDLIKKAILNNK